MRKSITTTFLALLVLSCIASCTQDSAMKRNIFGEVDADETDVASRLPGRIAKVLVQPGQVVKAGEVLIQFEDDIMAAKRRGAEATIAAAESKQAIANDAVRPEEKQQLIAAVSAAKKQMDFAKQSLDRMKSLVKDGAVAQQQVDEVQFKYDAAYEQWNAASAKLKLANIGARKEERAGAAALVEQAKTVLMEVNAYDKDMQLRAPIDGEVAKILGKEGELFPAGYPVVTIVKLGQPWVTMRMAEDQLAQFPKESKVKVAIPGVGGRELDGSITYISSMPGFATRSFTQDRAQYDIKTFELRVTLNGDLKDVRPGMTAIIKKI